MKHILLVDDDKKTYPIYKEELEEEHNFHVTWMWDASLVLNFLMENDVDIIVLDIMMPIPKDWSTHDKAKADLGMNTGIILHAKIRNNLPNIPIIILTMRRDVHLEDPLTKTFVKPMIIRNIAKEINKILVDD